MDLLVDLLIIWFIVLLYRRWMGMGRPHLRPEQPQAAAGRRVRSAGQMTPCAHCGLYLPRTEAVTGPDGKTYCSREHARARA